MLQRVFIEKNINRRFSLNLSKFCNKNNCPQCLVVFAIVILGFSTIRIREEIKSMYVCMYVCMKPFKRFSIAFFVSSRKSKSYILDSEVILLEANKRHIKHASRPNSSTES